MNDPERLRAKPESVLERSLLDAGRGYTASPSTRARTLSALGLATVTTPPSTGVGGLGKAGLVKWGAALLVVGGGLFAGLHFLAPPPAPRALVVGSVVAARSVPADHRAPPAEVSASESGGQVPSPREPRANSNGVGGPPSSAEPTNPDTERVEPSQGGPLAAALPAQKEHKLEASPALPALPATDRGAAAQREPRTESKTATTPPLAAELAALDIARSALSEGDPGGALRALDRYSQKFPQGKLGLEAEVLRIDALAKSNQVAAARKRAESFLRRYPGSVLASRVRADVGL